MKRKLLLALCAWLTFASVACAEGEICISTDLAAALLTVDGDEIISPGIYEDIFAVADGQLYALGERTEEGIRYALSDASGNVLTDFAYSMFSASENCVIFAQDGLYGAMNLRGEILLPAQYTQLAAASDERFLAMTADPFDDDADEIFLLNVNGEMRSAQVRSAEGLSAFSEGLTPWQDSDSKLYGYLAADGSIAVEAKFETAGRFESGAARVSVDGRLGLIDTNGGWLIEPEYDYLETGSGVTVGLVGTERFVVFGESFEELFRIEDVGLEAALVGESPILQRNGMLEVYDLSGQVIFETHQSAQFLPGQNGQLILVDDDWGANCVSLVGADGARSERMDQYLIPLDGGRYAFVRMNVASYYSEALQEIRYSCDYDTLRCGMIDADGNEILPAEYLEIRALGSERYLTVTEESLQMTDGDGNILWAYSGKE